ncbi:hypothetical protein C8R43DRAFT_1138321 [Mycena crocata]|nr:hypothetical protein C8R43DRAFT_1138321 [Mycena crocata]
MNHDGREERLAQLVEVLRKLTTVEKQWCKYHSLIQNGGYTLRARYQPDWIPECIRDPSKHPLWCEDMRQIGETIKEEFLDKYWGLEFLIPLTKILRRNNRNQRPDAAEALRRFMKLAATIDKSSGATRLVAREGFQPVHRLNRAVFSLNRGLRL